MAFNLVKHCTSYKNAIVLIKYLLSLHFDLLVILSAANLLQHYPVNMHALQQCLYGILQGGFSDGDISGPCLCSIW